MPTSHVPRIGVHLPKVTVRMSVARNLWRKVTMVVECRNKFMEDSDILTYRLHRLEVQVAKSIGHQTWQ